MDTNSTPIAICAHAFFRDAGGPEFLKAQSRAHKQLMDNSPTRITVFVYAFFLEAGAPEFRKAKSRDTNAQTLYEQPSQAYYCMRVPFLLDAGGP